MDFATGYGRREVGGTERALRALAGFADALTATQRRKVSRELSKIVQSADLLGRARSRERLDAVAFASSALIEAGTRVARESLRLALVAAAGSACAVKARPENLGQELWRLVRKGVAASLRGVGDRKYARWKAARFVRRWVRDGWEPEPEWWDAVCALATSEDLPVARLAIETVGYTLAAGTVPASRTEEQGMDALNHAGNGPRAQVVGAVAYALEIAKERLGSEGHELRVRLGDDERVEVTFGRLAGVVRRVEKDTTGSEDRQA